MYPSITVGQFCSYCIETSYQGVKLYDIDSEEVVFEGTMDEIPMEFEDLELQSFDCIAKNSDCITLNIDLTNMHLMEE